jgi:hypothetical protein
MKVLLLYPEFPDTFWSFKHALKFIWKRAALLRSPNYFRAGAACRIEAERRRTAPPYREPAYLIAI